jgi:hypothetical protein
MKIIGAGISSRTSLNDLNFMPLSLKVLNELRGLKPVVNIIVAAVFFGLS